MLEHSLVEKKEVDKIRKYGTLRNKKERKGKKAIHILGEVLESSKRGKPVDESRESGK